jgi:phospholipase C
VNSIRIKPLIVSLLCITASGCLPYLHQKASLPEASSKKLPAESTQLTSLKSWESIRRVIVIVLENTDYGTALEMPFLKSLAAQGALLTQYYGVMHPSQPNYIAMIAGNPYSSSNDLIDLDAKHIGDLLEAQRLSWKVYAEDFPGNCFLGKTSGPYARRHVPFLSFKNVTTNPQRCRQVTSADEFDADYKSGNLPELSYYIPNNRNNGHDTGAPFADQWLKTRFGQILNPDSPSFDPHTLFVITFDEGSYFAQNQVYTVLIGSQIQRGSQSQRRYDHYSLLATIEKLFKLPSLGQKDEGAPLIDDPKIWKEP